MAPSPTTSRCARCWSARSGPSSPTRSSPPTRRRSSTRAGASTTPTTVRRGWPRSTRSIPRPGTRWPSRRWRAAVSRPTRSAGSTCSGPTGRTPGSTSRRPWSARSRRWRAHASQIHEPAELAERIRAWAAEEGAPIGVAAAEALRVIVIDDDEDEGPRLTVRVRRLRGAGGRTRPQSFQSVGERRRPGAPSSATSSPRLRSPAVAGEVLVRGDRDLGVERGHLGLGRPVADAHRVEPGVAERERQVALGRDALVDEAAEAVEPVAERGQGLGDLAILRCGEGAPERVVGRELERRRLDGDRDDRVDEPADVELPAALLGRVGRRPAARRAGSSRRGRRAGAGRSSACRRC